MERRTAVLLDQHPIWLEAVEHIAKRADVEVVGKTTSPLVALTLLGEHRPEVLVTEIEIETLPGEPDGIMILQRAREILPTLRVIAFASDDEPERMDAAFAAGAAATC